MDSSLALPVRDAFVAHLGEAGLLASLNARNNTAKIGHGLHCHGGCRFLWPLHLGYDVLPCPEPLSTRFGCNNDTQDNTWCDDGKWTCGLQRIHQASNKLHSQRRCVAFSLGSNNQWGFESSLLQRTSCRTHTFDCTCPQTCAVPAELGAARAQFHPDCVGKPQQPSSTSAAAGLSRVVSWRTVVEAHNGGMAPTLLKMDIEGAEWHVLPEMIANGATHTWPHILSLELHEFALLDPRSSRRTHVGSVGLRSFGSMLAAAGYVLVSREDNRICPFCTEVVFVRLQPPSADAAPKATAMAAWVAAKAPGFRGRQRQ